MKRCSRKTVLSIKVSLSLNHLKTREIGSFKRERYLCASAIRVDLSKTSGRNSCIKRQSDDPKLP